MSEVLLDAPGRGAPGAPAEQAMVGGIPVASDLSRSELLLAQRVGEVGSVHSWELVTAVDGPGTRMTTFLAGCPLRCLYCHNPDTMTANRGMPVRAEDLLARIRRYRGVFRATKGGITLSGGEVLQQPGFAGRILRGAKEMGIHTAIDTSGFLGANASDELLADVDLVLLDVKSGDEATYRRVTGRDLAPTLDFGRRLDALGIATWIRFVLVPGLTDDPDNIAPIADYAASLGNVERVEVLPFHQMGRAKWDGLGLRYELGDTEPPSAAQVAATRAIFEARGLLTY
ncbi:pyruvate formate-lyase 1-activating enzyme [Tessaracoccus aquimaris]|uniref:Pyruvate formate-lyase-activating enzyme n=1 Tax=Tessaracoccus aquimaris TaxID=1332264 RepID=A0A1Q2CNI6_9ACTN|nr:pyruvate formate-lyase-activating protein [Tessaracoccus aquimaris]AQP47610.1 pyruvate formate-lyase 1-activating enzyme [Tessaracoccus aquimaris]